MPNIHYRASKFIKTTFVVGKVPGKLLEKPITDYLEGVAYA